MHRSLAGRISIIAASLALSGIAHAQYFDSSEREPGWNFGFDLIYQDATTLNFDGGTTAKLDTDYGLSFTFAYAYSAYLEAQVALDWTQIDYKANIITGTGTSISADGSYQAFTPRVNLQWNFLDAPITPYVIGGIGYGFIDTNIPNGRPATGCWWDPWYGYICSTVQPTKSVDGFAYQVGLGMRWDAFEAVSLRLAVERHWADFGSAGTAHVDQIKLGFSRRF
jgi:opacity protein-like surface antigen